MTEGLLLEVNLNTSCSVSTKLFIEYKHNINYLKFQCLLGLEFLNTNKSGDMADLLKKFQEQHVPLKDGQILHKTVVHGDQLTEERARNVQWTYKLGETQADRLEGLECSFSEFHLKMCMFEVNFNLLISFAIYIILLK